MELGHELMDGEHAAQIRYMDAFAAALLAGSDEHDRVIALDRVVEFTNLHFMSEEMLMKQHAYPAADDHHRQHEQLLVQLRKMQDAFNRGDQSMTAKELATLRACLTDHILTTDKTFADFLAAHQG